MKFDVHVYATVRVKVLNVEADTHKEAAEKADLIACEHLYEIYPERDKVLDFPDGQIVPGGYAEEVTGFQVDIVGDGDYTDSQSFDSYYKKN